MDLFKEKMKLFEENKVISWHEHVWSNSKGELNEHHCDSMVESAYRTHIDILVCSNPVTQGNAEPDIIKRNNDVVAKAMKRYPKVIKGYAFVNPGYVKEAVAEIERCVNELGMIGVKLYNQYFISDPVVRSVIEKCIELDIPILEHAGKRHFREHTQPFISDGTHFATVARKYPQAAIIYGHIGGGGDWQWSLKAVADFPNIYVDTSGSVCDEGLIEQTVKYVGIDRIVFGTDEQLAQGIGKILGAKIPYEDKIKILNNQGLARYLERRI